MASALLPLDGAERVRVRAEHERRLESILIHVPSGAAATSPRFASPRYLDYAFGDVLDALPPYTSIHMAARAEQRDSALTLVRRAGEKAVQLHLVDDPSVEIELWAQDLGEPVVHEGQEKFLVSARMTATMGDPGPMSRSRKRLAQFLFGSERVLETDYVFEGGNLAFDGGRVLVGYNDVHRTITDRAHRGEHVSPSAVVDAITSTFGGIDVIEMGNERQSRYLQHLDQAFVLLQEGIAVVNRVRGGGLDRERRQLERYASQLRELGYDLLYLDHDAESIVRYWNSVNAVPFLDARSGRRTILYPVFPDEVDGSEEHFSKRAMRGKAIRAHDVYRDAGYEPVPVRDLMHVLGGNTHCIVNALS